jgi:hypothetical protein
MLVNSIIVDDFYSNPYEVREFALQQEFEVIGNYPGYRTKPFPSENAKRMIGDILRPFAGEITKWETEYTGCFQYTTAEDRSWIHSDSYNEWAAVLYLTPDAPISAGTGIFKHKESGMMKWSHKMKELDPPIENPASKYGIDYTKWEMVDRFGNLFNRLIIYRGTNFHVSLDYFGQDINDGRLFQVFFFSTEK